MLEDITFTPTTVAETTWSSDVGTSPHPEGPTTTPAASVFPEALSIAESHLSPDVTAPSSGVVAVKGKHQQWGLFEAIHPDSTSAH